jgi:ABC-type multidrug transport system permease subunit
MENVSNTVFWVCLGGLGVLALLGYRKSRAIGRLVFWIAALTLCGVTYFYVFQIRSGVLAKGEQKNDAAFVVILFICMLLGMACQYFYTLFMKPKQKRGAFDLGSFLAPVFASPLVFIPLLGAFQSSDIDLTSLTLPKFMVFFVAFENGFFWKEVVDNRRKEQKS